MKVKLGELAEWAGGRLVNGDPEYAIRGISTDTRTLRGKEVFIALTGPNFDGHEFIGDAVIQNAAAAVVSNEDCLQGLPGIIVSNTLAALGNIAHRYRWCEPLIPWIGITGSNGKTTTRELIGCILRKRGPIAISPSSFNNYVGVPLSIIARPPRAWAGVLEMGTSSPGEIARLTDIVTPTVAVVTSVGPAHLEGFKDIDSVAREKGSIFGRLPHDGVAIYPADDARTGILYGMIPGNRASFGLNHNADMFAENIELTTTGSRFKVRGVQFDLPLFGQHNIRNCLAALLVAEHLGIGLEAAAESLRGMKIVGMRLEPVTSGPLTIIDDSYNANPASIRAAVDVLVSFDAARRGVVVGDMLELGEESKHLHKEIGKLLVKKNIDAILAVGKHSLMLAEGASSTSARVIVRHYTTAQKLTMALKEMILPGDVVLVKGSRGMRMEKIVQALIKLGAALE